MISSSPHTSGSLPLNVHARKSPVRRVLAASLTALVLLVACSRQEEGDRCSLQNDDNDCESGLTCKEPDTLRGGSDEVARCCPPEGESISNDRCTPLIGGGGTGGGNAGGQAGESNASSTGGPGAVCSYNNDCRDDLVCGPQGKCQAECQE